MSVMQVIAVAGLGFIAGSVITEALIDRKLRCLGIHKVWRKP